MEFSMKSPKSAKVGTAQTASRENRHLLRAIARRKFAFEKDIPLAGAVQCKRSLA
jgi:hypothetical protein